MFKKFVLEHFKNPSPKPEISSIIVGAVRDALLFRMYLDQIKESIAFFVTKAKSDDSFFLAIQFWESVITTNINTLSSMTWKYISEEIMIIEHPGLSTYVLIWPKEFIKRLNLVTALLHSTRDTLDINHVVRLAEELYDLITTTNYNVNVYLYEYVESYYAKIQDENNENVSLDQGYTQ